MPTYDRSIFSKLPKVETTIFTKMSSMAASHGALNLSQGFPDFSIDKELLECAKKSMSSGKNQYAPMPGILSLREKIAEKIAAQYSIDYHPESEITITSGATQAIFTAITAFVKEQEEVIIFTPAYDCYQPAIELVGGKPVFVQLKSPEYRINWEEVKKLISQRTRMIIINTPHNPTGTIFSNEDLLELEKITADSEIIVLSDEVYEHIIFDQQKHASICNYKALAGRTLAVFSFGKTFHVTGWKIGYCIGPKQLMNEFRKVHQFNVFSSNHPMQHALAEYLCVADRYLSLGSFYQKKRDVFLQAIQQSRFKIIPCSGTYFQLLDYSAITHENDVDFAERLVKEFSIAAIPVSVFYNSPLDEKVLRFCFAKKEDTLLKAAEILSKV
ncbi:MAG: methionine aminotransferase [Flavobacteriales bacterium]|nr:methionine aminotransferase [Flavobacteriales bacterium]|tara:strand:- start:821 stop:1978 length:1158 start_codon:yes stop_codon:yes gene_type:complete